MLDEICDYVTLTLAPNKSKGSEDDFVRTFLSRLRDSVDIFSNRLLICIGIDLKTYLSEFGNKGSYSILRDTYRDIILKTSTVDLPATFSDGEVEAHIEFALALKKYWSNECIPVFKAGESARYTRITSFESYYLRIMAHNIGVNPELPSDLDPSNMKRFYTDLTEHNDYENINIANLGSSTGWVFATDQNDIQSSIDNTDLPTILDQIGYYIGSSLSSRWEQNTYVYLEYPELFSEEMLKPTALIGDWGRVNPDGNFLRGNEFFLSHRNENNWGRTFPVTGIGEGVKERVHYRFSYPDGRSYPFKVGALNELTLLLIKAENDKILEAAINRFNSI
ncbi:MAG: hypothetical protein ACO1N1_09295 [Dyadobacter fermentans]